MANNVKWIKLHIGMFDGMSFKKIKRAKIGGESFRDKLTAVWFELLDFAGKCNHEGAFISPREIPFTKLSDIAMMIDRDEEELRLCMNFFINEGMITVIDDIYMLSNWAAFQNTDRLSELREYNRIAKRKSREKQKLLQSVNDTSMTVQESQVTDKEVDIEIDTDIESENKRKSVPAAQTPAAEPPSVDYEQFKNLYNGICVNLPCVKMLSEKRKKAIRAFLKQLTVDDFKTVCMKANVSGFMTGKNDRGWKADFDFLVRVDKAINILEGKYSSSKESGSFDTDEFYEAALRKACGDDLYEEVYGKPKPKTAAEDPEIRAKADALKGTLQNG